MHADTLKIFVGLGNPGSEFEHTYHNAGALALQAIANGRLTNHGDPTWKTYRKLFAYARSGNAIFVRPLTFMNESGTAVSAALRKFGTTPGDLTILHDESDLPIGSYKISEDRNAAGHNGVQSIIDHLDTKNFTRIRIGIRPPDERERKKASTFVLARITKKDQAALETVFGEIEKKMASA